MYVPRKGLPKTLENFILNSCKNHLNDTGDRLVKECIWNGIEAYEIYDSLIKDAHIKMFSEFPILQNISRLETSDTNAIEEKGKYYVNTSHMDYKEFKIAYSKEGIIKL